MCCNYKILVLVIILLSQMWTEMWGKFVPRIRNGYSCNTTTIPYFVIIRTAFSCGASLITYSWVLTAAHCLKAENFKGVFRTLSTVHTRYDMPNELRQVRNIKRWIQHPNFSAEGESSLTGMRHDIGLVLVEEPFEQNAATQVATLPAPGYTKHCSSVMATGTGNTVHMEDWKQKGAETRPLLCVDLILMDSDSCKKNYSKLFTYFDTTRIICAHGPNWGEGSCPGDSGGPLICDNVVIGLVSGSPDCVEPRKAADFFTKVESYLDFIDQYVKFTGINVKYSRLNDTGGGGQKPSNNTNNKHVLTNGTSAGGKKASNKSPGNIVQGPNWRLVLLTFLYSFSLYR